MKAKSEHGVERRLMLGFLVRRMAAPSSTAPGGIGGRVVATVHGFLRASANGRAAGTNGIVLDAK